MAFQIIHGFRKKQRKKWEARSSSDALPLHHPTKGVDCDYDMHGHAFVMMTTIKLPQCATVLRLIARSLLLALIFVSLPVLRTALLSSQFSSATNILRSDSASSSSSNFDLLSLVFRDLTNEGLLNPGDKALILSNKSDYNERRSAIRDSQPFNINDMKNVDLDVISSTDSERQNMVPDESFDLTFAFGSHNAPEFVHRALKVGGIVVVRLNDYPFLESGRPSNYKIVYFRRFESSVLAMRKTAELSASNDNNSAAQRRLLGYSTEERKAALKKLENVLLEPPRAASGISRTYLKKTRYLPDLTGDSLEGYPRRVFIDVGLPEREGGSGTGWFEANYPTRNLDFDMYKIETVTEESSGKEVLPEEDEVAGGMSEWLRKNVKEEEYVVMKAEAEVVEEVVKGKAIGLVDELFLECKPKGHGGHHAIKSSRRSRAYWECLALYGKLRDEGVAVHQWWG